MELTETARLPSPSADRLPRVTLHRDEIPVDEELVRSLLRAQRPEWAGLPLSPAGADNIMYRLGDDLLVRFHEPPTTAVPYGRSRNGCPASHPS